MGKAYVTNAVRTDDNTGSEPVTVAQMKTHLQLEGTAFDAILEPLITAVRQSIENYCNVSLVPKQLVVTIRSNGTNPFALPFPPVGTISSVYFKPCRGGIFREWSLGEAGADYVEFDTGMIEPDDTGYYRVTYTTTANGLEAFSTAIKLQVGYLFNNINETNKPQWDATALAIMNANKNSNY